MKIVVCDDDEKFLKEFKTVLQERLTSLEIEAELTMYSTGKKLVEVCEQEEIDVLFLDIDMPEVDGFKIAESVRKKELNCLIVFCSNYSDFVFKSFRYEPFSFLCKENYQEQLSDVMKRIYEKWSSRKKEFTYQIKGGGVRIKQRDILYIDTSNHKIFIHTIDEVYEFREKLSFVEEELDAQKFVKINSGCIVNLAHIYKIHENLITLKNKQILTISRSNKKKVKDKFFDFLER